MAELPERLIQRRQGDAFEGSSAGSPVGKRSRGDSSAFDPLSGIPFVQADETIRLRIRQRLQQDGVDDRKDRGIGADAERQRKNDADREPGGTAEGPKRVSQVVEHRGSARRIVNHQLPPVRLALVGEAMVYRM